MEPDVRIPCPYCREMILENASKCKACGSSLRRQYAPSGGWIWSRNLPDRKVLGVAACIAANLRVSPTIVRLVFVLLTFVSFLGVFIYLALAAVVPAVPGERSMFEVAVDGLGSFVDKWRTKIQATPVSVTAVAPVATPPAAVHSPAPVVPACEIPPAPDAGIQGQQGA